MNTFDEQRRYRLENIDNRIDKLRVYDMEHSRVVAENAGSIPEEFRELIRLANLGALAERAFGHRASEALVGR